MRFFVFTLLLAAMALPMLLASSVTAQEGIQVVSTEVESQFPDGILFKLSASGPDEIEEIRVFFRVAGSELRSYGYLDFQPATMVTGEYLLATRGGGPTTGSRHMPPGTMLTYSFEIRDKGGRVFQTEERDFIYMDTRFEWNQVSRGPVTVYYYGPTEKRAETVLEAALETLDRMGSILGISAEEPIRVVAYNNPRHMSAALPFRAQAVREELLTEGQAWPNYRVLLVLAFASTIRGITSHELSHILIYEATAPNYSRVPAWLNEGLAEYANLEPMPGYDRAISYAIFSRRLKPLWYLQDFSGDPDDIVIAYGMSSSVVAYLVDTYGQEKVDDLMAALRQGQHIDDALQEVYGFDQHGLDSEWRMGLGLPPLPSPEEIEATPTPTPTATPTPPPSPTPEAEEVTPGCNIQRRGKASLPLDLALLALLGGPPLLLPWRRLWREKFSGRGG